MGVESKSGLVSGSAEQMMIDVTDTEFEIELGAICTGIRN